MAEGPRGRAEGGPARPVVEPGQVWLRKRGSAAVVRRVLAVADGRVHYEVLHGPPSARRGTAGACNLRSFLRHAVRIEAQEDYSLLDGASKFATFLVLGTRGQELLRCSQKRASFYLRKGYARVVRPGVLQFTDDATERHLEELYLGDFSEFFMAVKNDRCCVCGRASNLTRHHVVPTRYKAKMPARWRCCISNILFVCGGCHERYEAAPEPKVPAGLDWLDYARLWRDHFLAVTRPEHLPPGWDIVSVKNLDAVEVPGEESSTRPG